jgi:hypothetical protein
VTPNQVTLTLTHQEFFLIKSAVEELLNDSDVIWGNADDSENSSLYAEVKRLADRLEKIEQMEVITH